MEAVDTIYAYSTGDGVSGVAVLRISGPGCKGVIDACIRRDLTPRNAHFTKFFGPDGQDILDWGIAIFFPGPASATGEDCLELHTHGSLAVRNAMYSALARIPGCRLAEAGEFTKRAFVNGKLDLVGVEAVGDLLEARTDLQRRQALRSLNSDVSMLTARWRSQILECLAIVEAAIDFVDEGDAPEEFYPEVCARCDSILKEMQAVLLDSKSAEVVRSGLRVAICGKPNAGKSSLLNYLAKREAAIVSEIPGTTRDVIEVSIDLDGLLVVFSDTAGIRATADSVESIGIARARSTAVSSDLILWLFEGHEIDPVDQDVVEAGVPVLKVSTKMDLFVRGEAPVPGLTSISVKSGAGIDALRSIVLEHARAMIGSKESVVFARARQRQLIESCVSVLERVHQTSDLLPDEVLAEELREVANHIGAVTGVIGVEDVLGEIFQRFCMGK